MPFLDDIGAVADTKCLLNVVVGDENGDVQIFKTAYFMLKVFDSERVDAGEGLIEKNQARVCDEGAGDFEFAAFTSGTCAGEIVCFVHQAVLFEEFGAAEAALASGALDGFENGEEVLLDSEPLEDAGLLAEIAHAAAGAFIHREAGYIAPGEVDSSAVSINHADGHAEACGLAGAVSAEQTDDFGFVDIDGDIADDPTAGVLLDEIARFEKSHTESVAEQLGC